MVASRKDDENNTPRQPPAMTPQARENQLIALSFDLVEARLRKGTASSQETTHFLKLGSTMTMLEKDNKLLEQEVARARLEQLSANSRLEELMQNAIDAMRMYQGLDDEYE